MQPGFISTELLGRFVHHKLKFEGGVRIDRVAAARSGCGVLTHMVERRQLSTACPT
ncbi:hypothetical protein GGD64_008387 [Bradyrhizobium sp. CIR3A]|nr:hypothetical protein [Bradyrhizobium sp. CIR3A]